jgi:hypothetical protein
LNCIEKTTKKTNQSASKFLNPLSPLIWPPRSVSSVECPRSQNAPECGLLSCFRALPERPSVNPGGCPVSARPPDPRNLNQSSGRLRILRGLEEKKLNSPHFRISALKRLSYSTKSPKHTAGKTLSTEPRTLHANTNSLSSAFLPSE